MGMASALSARSHSTSFKVWLVFRFVASGGRLLSLPSAVSMLGLAIGVACMTLAMSVVSGFENTLRAAVIDVFGHVLVVRKSEKTTSVEAAIEKIRDAAPGIKAYTPFLQMEGIVAKDGKIAGVVVQGLEPRTVESVLRLRQRLIAGAFDFAAAEPGSMPAALIGKGVAKRFGLKPGDPFQVVLPTPSRSSTSEFRPKSQAFRVAGVLDLGKNEYDERYVVTDLKSAQALGEVGEGFSGLRLLLNDANDARQAAAAIHRALGSQYYLMDWFEVNKNLFEAVAFERFVIFFVLLTMLIAAAFNVSSNLFVNVLQRYPDMSILKAMGFARRDVVAAFAIHGLIFGIVGTAIGLLLGAAFAAAFELAQTWFVLMPADVYKLDHVGVTFRPQDLAAVVCASLAICLAATVAPALRGSRLNPVEGLRYE